MRLLPRDAFEIKTTMSREEAVRRIDSRIGYPGADHFRGQIQPEGFTISRMIRYRNSFAPVILGQFRQEDGGLVISIRMRMDLVTTGVMAVWFLMGIGMFIVMGVMQLCTEARVLPYVPVAGGVILLFGWAMMSGGFWYEAKKARAILMDIFGDQEVRRAEGKNKKM